MATKKKIVRFNRSAQPVLPANVSVRGILDAKKAAIAADEEAMAKYIRRVRDAMVTSSTEMSRDRYIEALGELRDDITGMLEAAEEERREGEEP